MSASHSALGDGNFREEVARRFGVLPSFFAPSDGQVERIGGIGQDVTALKRIEAALRESGSRLRDERTC